MPIVPVVGAFIDASPGSIYLFFRLAVLIPEVHLLSSFLRREPSFVFLFSYRKKYGRFYSASGTPQQEPKPLLGPLPGT